MTETTFVTNAVSQDILLASAPKPEPPVADQKEDQRDDQMIAADQVVTQMLAATDATRTVILLATARKPLRDVTDAINQVIWLRIVKMRSKVVHAITVERLVIYNVIANKQATSHATNAKRLDIWLATAPLRSQMIDL